MSEDLVINAQINEIMDPRKQRKIPRLFHKR